MKETSLVSFDQSSWSAPFDLVDESPLNLFNMFTYVEKSDAF